MTALRTSLGACSGSPARGPTLDGLVPVTGGSYRGWRQARRPGDLPTCTGNGTGFGADGTWTLTPLSSSGRPPEAATVEAEAKAMKLSAFLTAAIAEWHRGAPWSRRSPVRKPVVHVGLVRLANPVRARPGAGPVPVRWHSLANEPGTGLVRAVQLLVRGPVPPRCRMA